MIAANIQKNLLPKELKINFDLDLSEYFKPAKEIGGDYYDYIQLNQDELMICLADVSGKGISAAILMSNFQANWSSRQT